MPTIGATNMLSSWRQATLKMEAAAKRLQPIAMPMAPVAMAIPAYTCNTYLVAADMCAWTCTKNISRQSLWDTRSKIKGLRVGMDMFVFFQGTFLEGIVILNIQLGGSTVPFWSLMIPVFHVTEVIPTHQTWWHSKLQTPMKKSTWEICRSTQAVQQVFPKTLFPQSGRSS